MDFRIQTAILSGGKTKELRVFSVRDIDVATEKMLTQRLCRLMDKNETEWRKYVRPNEMNATACNFFTKLIFRARGIYITNLHEVHAIQSLERAFKSAALTLVMVDAATRYIDCYCAN